MLDCTRTATALFWALYSIWHLFCSHFPRGLRGGCERRYMYSAVINHCNKSRPSQSVFTASWRVVLGKSGVALSRPVPERCTLPNCFANINQDAQKYRRRTTKITFRKEFILLAITDNTACFEREKAKFCLPGGNYLELLRREIPDPKTAGKYSSPNTFIFFWIYCCTVSPYFTIASDVWFFVCDFRTQIKRADASVVLA